MGKTICSIEGCESAVRARGWCNKHWKRWSKHGDPEWVRPERVCSIEGCGLKHHGQGWCRKHRERYLLNGDPLAVGTPHYRTPSEAFSARTVPDGDCLAWTGRLDDAGYGELRVEGRMVYAHRYAWEQEHGPIPDGLFIDHRCWNTACVRVDHLRLATPTQNAAYLRGAKSNSSTGVRGVYPNREGFRGQVRKEGVVYDVGTYSTVEEAARAVERKRAELYGEFAGLPHYPEETP